MAHWSSSTTTSEVMSALVAALGAMPEITKDKSANIGTKAGGSYGYKYADLASVIATIRPVLHAHGLGVLQNASTLEDDMVAISTTIIHKSGEFIRFEPLMLPAGRTAQETGSAITYGRRYHLLAALGLAADDDDGASAAPRRARGTSVASRPRQQAEVEPRTAYEGTIRLLIGQLSEMDRSVIRDRFRQQFGALVDLPVERHEEALTWTRDQIDQLRSASA